MLHFLSEIQIKIPFEILTCLENIPMLKAGH